MRGCASANPAGEERFDGASRRRPSRHPPGAFVTWQLDRSGALQQGREEGREEGQRRLLRRQLERKFGPLSGDTLARVEAATSDRLEEYADRVLDATSLAGVPGD